MGAISFPEGRRILFYSSVSDCIKNETLDEARQIFDKIPNPNVHLCTKMITGFTQNNRLKDALQLFDEMPVRDTIAWNSMIKGCLECRDLAMARKLFDQMPDRNVVAWTTMINGYMQLGRVEVAERLFREMPSRDTAAWNCMIYGYCSNGKVDEAVRVFEQMPSRNVISWTSMISGLDQNGRSEDALRLFQQMVGYGIEPTTSTFSCLISACANALAVDLGAQIHSRVVKLGLVLDEFVASSLITFYANCQQLENSVEVFNEKAHGSVVVWTSLLTGYSLNLKHGGALEVFSEMIKRVIFPNDSSFTSALNSCCAIGSLDAGKMIHAEAVKLGFEASAFVGNSLITFYSKCGSIQDAIKTFQVIRQKNLVSWNSILVGCAQYGHGMWALAFFTQMLRTEVEPDEITFTGLLCAANHSGMWQKGRHFFQFFSKYMSIEITLQHYACVVDIICHCGRLDEAEEFIKNMPVKANSLVWLALLNACCMHSNFEIAERASKCIMDLDPNCSAAYTLLSNLYASAGRWSDVSRIRMEMRMRDVAKQKGCSWLTPEGDKQENYHNGIGDSWVILPMIQVIIIPDLPLLCGAKPMITPDISPLCDVQLLTLS
ncbi:hypothetical protein Cgig2_029363 [Carnegiea gigantea]|uniref:Chlororespiratory reduction 4 n=1 Tax=Carnegiea gigantea TaxID=171969 RepID=A0A9Q1QQI4_9CARY|nr:hypothetical protein Cgig2_029363 [Carnegiea gigantea]